MIASDLADAAIQIGSSVLCRVWITGPGDLCSSCAMVTECPDRTTCLHLCASVGLTARLDGPFRRFPFGARDVGRVARTLEPLVVLNGVESRGVADPAWLARHGIRSFGAWPLQEAGACRGVLVAFGRAAWTEAVTSAFAALARVGSTALAGATAAASPESRELLRAEDPERDFDSPSMADTQRRAILAALARTGGKLSGPGGAAEILGMKPTTLESRIRRLGLRKPPRLKLR